MKLVLRKHKYYDKWFVLEIGDLSHTSIAKEELPDICYADVLMALAEGKEVVECILLTREGFQTIMDVAETAR